MRKVLVISATALVLATLGCAATRSGEAPINEKTTIRCPKCGYPFEVGEGMREIKNSR